MTTGKEVVKSNAELGVTKEMQDMPWGETLSSQDYNLPRIDLVQGLSASAKTVSPGNWYHSQNNQDLGKEIGVVILDVVAGHMLKDETGNLIAIKWKSAQVKSFKPELITEDMIINRKYVQGSKAGIVDAYCYIAILNQSEPCLITLKASGCKAARNLNSMLAKKVINKDGNLEVLPPFLKKFKFSSRWVEKGAQIKFWEPIIQPDGINEGGYLKAAAELAKDLKNKTIAHDVEESDTAEPATGGAAPF